MENYDEDFDYKFAEDYVFDCTVNGIELDLIGEAYQTGRYLDYSPYGCMFEMESLAVGRDRKRYLVRWIFKDNGEEGFDAYDYSKYDDCVLIDEPNEGVAGYDLVRS